MSIKHRIADILKYHLGKIDLYNSYDLHQAVQEMSDMIEEEIMTAVKTAVQVRIHGIPQ